MTTPQTTADILDAGSVRERAFIMLIAATAREIGWQAGVGASETAGAIVSYLAQRPEQIGSFARGEIDPTGWPDWIGGGCLTWQTADGRIIDPAEYRAAKAAAAERAASDMQPPVAGKGMGA